MRRTRCVTAKVVVPVVALEGRLVVTRAGHGWLVQGPVDGALLGRVLGAGARGISARGEVRPGVVETVWGARLVAYMMFLIFCILDDLVGCEVWLVE